MEHALEILWAGLAIHLWQSTWVLAALAVVASTLRGAPARFGERVGWLAVAKLLVPAGLFGVLAIPPVTRTFGAGGVASFRVIGDLWNAPAVAARSTGVDAPWGLLLTSLWFAGAVLVLERTVRGIVRARATPAVPPSGTTPPVRDTLDSAAEIARVDVSAIRVTTDPVMPHVSGLLSPRIVIPDTLVGQLSVDELAGVLLHEDAHRRRREPLRILLHRLILALFFFFPPVWLLLRYLAHHAEIACDERALAGSIDRECYVRAMAKTVHHGLAPVPAACADGREGRSFFARRLERVARQGGFVVMNRHRVALVAAGLVVFAGFLALEPGSVATSSAEASANARELGTLRNANRFVRLNFEVATVGKVLDTLSQASGVRIVWKEGTRDLPVSVEFDGTVEDALLVLSDKAFLTYDVPNPETVVVSGLPHAGYVPPRPIEQPEPTYPPELRAKRLSGVVVLTAEILEDGTIGRVSVVKADPPEAAFKASAVEAVKRWTFEPARNGSQPIRTVLTLRLEFDPPAST